tara:strand:+ start:10828 stop:11736 length:909 start_codon:yes stop_codon:yes gene_type:complete
MNIEKLKNYALHGPFANQKMYNFNDLFTDLGLKSEPLSMDFNYDPATVTYQTNPYTESGMTNMGDSAAGMTTDINSTRDTAATLSGLSGEAADQARSFMDPESAWYKTQMSRMREGLAGQNTIAHNLQGRSLAARGINDVGMRNLLGDVSGSSLGEQLRQGQFGLTDMGNKLGATFLNQAMSGYGQVGNLYSQAGSLGAQQGSLYGQQAQLGQAESQAALQAAMANQSATNEATQFDITGSYNQQLANNQSQDNFMNNIMSIGGTIAAAALAPATGGASLLTLAGNNPFQGSNPGPWALPNG